MATILGTAGPNVINGTNDPGDVIFARAGNDLVNANAGNDLVFGELGNDVLVSGLGDERLNGGLGNDTLNGGVGIDTADYSSSTIDPPGPIGPQPYTGATAGVTVNLNLAGAQNTGEGGIDQLIGIENVFGTNFKDVLTGNSANNVFSGLAGNDTLLCGNGNDTLNGGAGNDVLNGGTGSDTASYTSATANVSVNLTLAGAQNTGGGGIDTLVSIENLTGSTFNDTLTGNSGANVLDGRGGNDQLIGGAGNDRLLGGSGNDVLNGGPGSDTADYSTATAGVTVHLDLMEGPLEPVVVNTAGAGIDTLVSIESLTGSNFKDTLSVSGGEDSTLTGGDGDDHLYSDHADNATLNGGAGNDKLSAGQTGLTTLNGEAGNDTLTMGDAHGTLNGGTGDDKLSAGWGTYTLNGGDGNDLLETDSTFAAPQAILNGGAGNDVLKADSFGPLNGGAGADTLEHIPGVFGPTILTFVYNAVSDSPAGTGKDKIIGFVGKGASVGDKIDLSTIDANTLLSGNQAFTWKGATPGGAGTLWYTGGVLSGNVDGDAAPEFEIELLGAPTLSVGGTGTDIIL